MAVKTFYLLGTTASGSSHGALQDGGTAPGAATTATGWNIGQNAIPRFSLMAFGTEVGRTSITSTTTVITGASGPGTSDCWRSDALNGAFAAGNWTLAFPMRAVSSATGQDARLRLRVWRAANETGTGATELTSSVLVTSAFTNLLTTADQTCSVTWAAPAVTLTDEHLFFQVEYESTGVATNNNADAAFRLGSASKIDTTDFTPAAVSIGGEGFTDPDEFGTQSAEAAIAVDQAGFSDADAFGTQAAAHVLPPIGGAGFDDADEFGTQILDLAAGAIGQAGFADADAFGAQVVAPGAVSLAGAGFVDDDAFGAQSAAAGAIAIAGAGFGDADAFGAQTLTGAGDYIGAAGFADPDAFGGQVVATSLALSGAGFDDADAFGTQAAAAGAVVVAGGGFADGDLFGASVVVRGASARGPVRRGRGTLSMVARPSGGLVVGPAPRPGV